MTTETEIDYASLLYAYHEHKQNVSQSERDWLKTPFKMDADRASSVLKEHMEREGLEELRDGEHGITGTLGKRGNKTWDIRNAPVDLILWLAQNGYLDVKTKKVETDYRDAPSMWLNLIMDKKYRNEGEILVLRTAAVE